jgi:hypothetical protein
MPLKGSNKEVNMGFGFCREGNVAANKGNSHKGSIGSVDGKQQPQRGLQAL